MKLFLMFALVAVASANISQLFSKYLPPARSNNQGPSNSVSILPALLQLKQSFGGQQGSAQQGFGQQSFGQQQQQIVKVIHVSAAPQQQQQQQQQQYYSAPQQSYRPSNQYLPPVTQNEPVYHQSHPVDRVTINAPSPVYQQQAPQVNYQSAPIQHEPIEIQVHVQNVAPKAHYVQQPQVQYVQQPQVQHVAPKAHYVQQPQVQYVQQPQVHYAAPQVEYVQNEPQAYEAPSQSIQAPAASFSEVSGYNYNAPH